MDGGRWSVPGGPGGPTDPFGPVPFDPGTPFGPDPRDDGDPDELMDEIRHAMLSGEPTDMLMQAGSLLSATDPRSRDPFAPDPGEEAPSIDLVVESLVEVERPETTGLLAVFAALTSDELLRQRIRRALSPTRLAHPDVPAWLTELDAVEVVRIVEQTHVLGDGDDILVGASIGGHPLSVLVYVDHNMGTVVKDAFVVPEPVESLVEAFHRAGAGTDDYSFTDLDPAEARAKLTEAVDHGAMTVPRFETDTWPACRPVLEWLVRSLPEGGEGYVRPEWSDAETARLLTAFMSSPEGSSFDDEHHRDLMDSILWFGTGYGPGDPLRWSEVSVEILLLDWVPRKIVADPDFLSSLPDLLRAFIRYSHRVRAIRTALTDDVLDSVDRFEASYQQLIRSDRPQGPEALMASLGVGPDADLQKEIYDAIYEGLEADLEERFGSDPAELADAKAALAGLFSDPVARYRQILEARAGGAEALESLDADPLPDEPFDWSGIDDDVHDRVREVLDLLDGVADRHFDVEFRTACRRLLARIAADGSAVFRRKGSANTAAAAIAWVLAKENGKIDLYSGHSGMMAKDLLAAFDVKGSVSQRAGAMLRAAGLLGGEGQGYDAAQFIPPVEMLTSEARAELVGQRDNLPALAEVLVEPTAPGERVTRTGTGVLYEATDGADTVHSLKVTIEGTKPPVWRRLVVPSDATLGDLHQIIQVVFGWTNSHLHAFEIDGERFEPESPVGGFDGFGPDPYDEDDAPIAEVLDEGDRALYTYDFGDNWEHRIEVEAIESRGPDGAIPLCTAGRRAGPPEDVGGTWGFTNFLAAMANPDHPEHHDLLDWHGGPYDPTHFDREAINAWFRANTEPR